MMPRDPRAYLQRAEEHRRHGRLKEAIALSIEALGKHPGLDAVRVTLGRAYLENAQPEEARTTLRDVFSRLPEHHLAGKLLVESQRLLGDLAGAAATCRTLLEHYPRDREIEPLLAEIVKAQSMPAPAGAADEADPEPDYLPEDLGPPRAASPGVVAEPLAKTAAPASAAAPGLSSTPTEKAIEAARPPIPATTLAPKAPPVTPVPPSSPLTVKLSVPDLPATPPMKVATAPPAPAPMPHMASPVAESPIAKTPAPVAPTPAAIAPAPVAAAPVASAPVPAAVAAVPTPAAATSAAAKRDALETNTLAELYVKQGLPDRAIEVYRSMLRVEPGNAAARRRLAELESAGGAAPGQAAKPSPPPPARPAAAAAPVSAPAPVKSTGATAKAGPSPSPSASAPVSSPALRSAVSEPPPPYAVASSPPAAATAAPAAAASAPAAAHPNRAAIERLERWLDDVKRGQKSLDDGAAA
jgi:pentatricopeptide repeat protein